MNDFSIGIKLLDTEYAEALARRLALDHKGLYIAIIKEDESGKNGSSARKPTHDVILFDFLDNNSPNGDDISDGSLYILMRDKKSFEDKEAKGRSIYKYQSVTGILKNIQDIYAENNEGKELHFDVQKPMHISFLGISGGAGTSSVAVNFSRELSRYKDKKVIYVNFEQIESVMENKARDIRKDEAKTSSDIVYYLLQNRYSDIAAFWERYTYHDEYGLERIKPSTTGNEFASLNASETEILFNCIYNSGRYEYVIADLGNHINSSIKSICGLSDKLIIVDTFSSTKKEMHKTMISKLEEINPECEIFTLINKYEDEPDETKIMEGNADDHLVVRRTDNDTDMSNIFGIDINRLLKEIVS